MNLIGLVLTIVLMALISNIGYFYGGPAYTNSKTSAEIAKLQDDINQLSSALRLSQVMGASYSSEEILDELISSGVLTDAPKFNGNEYEFWGVGSKVQDKPTDSGSGYAFIAVKGLSAAVCSEINKKNGNTNGYEVFGEEREPIDYYFTSARIDSLSYIPLSSLPSMICFAENTIDPQTGGDLSEKNAKYYAMFTVDKTLIKIYADNIQENP